MEPKGSLVIFELNGKKYGLPVLGMQEIVCMIKVKPLHMASVNIEGVISLRGQLIPVLYLNRCLGLPGKEQDRERSVIVSEQRGIKIGFIVDKVLEVGNYSEADIGASDVIAYSIGCFSGFVKKDECIWLLLNPEVITVAVEYPVAKCL